MPAFAEPFFGYRTSADGTHDGKTLIEHSEHLMAWIAQNVEQYSELRVADAVDNLVMHIQERVLTWPKDGASKLIWNVEVHNWVPIDPPTLAGAPKPAPARSSCIHCNTPFGKANVFTELGWKETLITGMCEKCWDEMFKDKDD